MSDDTPQTKILILAANPNGTKKLRLDEEVRDIKEGLRQSKERDRFIIESDWAIRHRDVRRAILYFKPHIVHFSGHGSEDGYLAFENEVGQVKFVNPEALAGLFELFSSHVQCVILNACYSEIQANAIVQHINFVIGMNSAIGDSAAIEFAVGFYDAIGAGCPVKKAYKFGCNAIQMAGINEYLTPVLKQKNNSPSNINSSFISQSPSRDSRTRSATFVKTKITYEFVLTGNIDEVNKQKLEAIVTHLKDITGDTSLTLLKTESGSIKLVLEGSEEGFQRLSSLVASGELDQVMGMSIQAVRPRQLSSSKQALSSFQQVSRPQQVRILGARSGSIASEPDVGFTFEGFAALRDTYHYDFRPGDIVVGRVLNLEPRGALVDIGAKTAAYLPIQEMSINQVDSPDEVLQSHETREFFILTDENEDGQLTLSIRRIEYIRAWERVRQLQAEDATVRACIFATNRGGALVRIEGLRGFIPGSHISTRKSKEDLLGEELPLKFLEVDEVRNRLVLSHRRALVERKVSCLEVGEVVTGLVRGIKPYGVFIDIGGVSGLLHISEISHDHLDTPHSVFNVNDEVKVMIVDLDVERGRISLSSKQLEPEPGDMLKNPQIVYDKAEEMAAKYREQMQVQQQATGLPAMKISVPDDAVFSILKEGK